MNNFNFDENTVNKLKEMMNKGELNDVLSNISPETIKNFSSMMNQNTSIPKENSTNSNNLNQNSYAQNNVSNSSSENSSFNLNNLDMNTILKMKSVMENLNNKNDARFNLLNSIKPYLRDSRKEKIDQYANLLNVAKIAELLKNENKENPND